MKLLSIETDAKTSKNSKYGYLTGILYLAPYTVSGTNVCPMAEKAQCFKPCLYSAGHGAMDSVQQARINRTNFLYNDRQGFISQLLSEIRALDRKAFRLGLKAAVRLNGTSDVPWHTKPFGSIPQQIQHVCPDVMFYDYTKTHKAFSKLPSNYYVLWSYSSAPEYLAHGQPNDMNWSVVFDGALPKNFMGRKVIDGDKHDLRFLDPHAVVVGLKAKGKAKGSSSPLVVTT